MMRLWSAWFLILLGVPLLNVIDSSGLKITFRHSWNGISSERTVYIHQDRRRMEYRSSAGGDRQWYGPTGVRYGPHLASIERCDLGQMFDLNLDSAEYEGPVPYPPRPFTKEQMDARGIKPPQYLSGEPTVRIETTTVDTGERNEFFGRTARHVVTTRKEIPLVGSQSEPRQTVTDGWYINLDTSTSCDRKHPAGTREHARVVAGNKPVEKAEFVDHGASESGFAVQSRTTYLTTIPLPDGKIKDTSSTDEMQVTELVEGPVDPALFTIPTGFRQVAHIERNPPADLPSQWSVSWDRVKQSISRMFIDKF